MTKSLFVIIGVVLVVVLIVSLIIPIYNDIKETEAKCVENSLQMGKMMLGFKTKDSSYCNNVVRFDYCNAVVNENCDNLFGEEKVMCKLLIKDETLKQDCYGCLGYGPKDSQVCDKMPISCRGLLENDIRLCNADAECEALVKKDETFFLSEIRKSYCKDFAYSRVASERGSSFLCGMVKTPYLRKGC